MESLLGLEASPDETWAGLGQLLEDIFIWTKMGKMQVTKHLFGGDFSLVKKTRRLLKLKL